MDEREVPGVRPGDVLAGKYRVERVLGAGGMGVVVAAHHLQLDQRVAIKFLLPEALANSEVVARFAREARAAVKIKSEYVVRVIDVGSLESGAPYIVMEYLEGGDLSQWIQQRGPLPIELAVEFTLQACEAIADAHGLGIIHRDLKPANLFCISRSDGLFAIKVLDFGISKVTQIGDSAPQMQMTKTSATMGSPFYMSPEQMASARDVDCRTDIWALGTILFELLSGQSPFAGETLPEVCYKIAAEPAPRLRAFRPDAPPELEAAILKCLEKDRARRFSDVGQFAVALAPFGPRRSRVLVERISRIMSVAGLSASAPVSLAPASAQPGAPSTMAGWGHTAKFEIPGESKGPSRIVLAVALLVVLAGAGLLARRLLAPSARVEPSAPIALVAHVSVAAQPPASVVASAAPIASASAPGPVASAAPVRGQGAKPASRPGAAAPPLPVAPVPAAAKVSCNPPYVIDAAGHRQYKPECLK
jgi:eukaryotic-like serine/threonine-protein kinase